MGSSYRSDLKRGGMPDWEAPLREAVRLVRIVIGEVWETIGGDGQYDNAADDGGLAERLGIARRLIEGELPDEVSR